MWPGRTPGLRASRRHCPRCPVGTPIHHSPRPQRLMRRPSTGFAGGQMRGMLPGKRRTMPDGEDWLDFWRQLKAEREAARPHERPMSAQTCYTYLGRVGVTVLYDAPPSFEKWFWWWFSEGCPLPHEHKRLWARRPLLPWEK